LRASTSAFFARCGRRASFVSTGGLGLGDAGPLPLQHQLALELGDAGNQGDQQAAGRGAGVDAQIEYPESDAPDVVYS
jgi:hypothetical protein